MILRLLLLTVLFGASMASASKLPLFDGKARPSSFLLKNYDKAMNSSKAHVDLFRAAPDLKPGKDGRAVVVENGIRFVFLPEALKARKSVRSGMTVRYRAVCYLVKRDGKMVKEVHLTKGLARRY